MESIRTLFLPSPPEPLPLYWIGLGEERRRLPGYRWHGLKRGTDQHLLWQLTLSGRGYIEIAGSHRVALEPGRGFLARIPSDHLYYFAQGDPAWHFVWAMWSGPALGAIWESLNQTDVRLLSASPSGPEAGFVRALVRRRTSGLPSTRAEALDSYRLLLDLCSPGRDERRSAASRLIPRLEKAVKRHPAASIGKDGLASALALSRFQLYRAVRKETGRGPKEWTARRRLDRACRLLRDTRRTVAEIAVEVGLPDANYFARFFRKQTGFSPGGWRRLFAPEGRNRP